VLGNHDFESGKQDEVRDILADAGVMMLDGDACEVLGVGFAGCKGFAGGFGRSTLGAWGEDVVKRFVHEAIEEALKLESALVRLRTDRRFALLHYAPIEATLVGEALPLWPFLGSYLLAEAVDRAGADLVLHGHAHAGCPEGVTAGGIPVLNVAQPVIRRPFVVLGLEPGRAVSAVAAPTAS
jgi:Icc-related predicted phosphoesterase